MKKFAISVAIASVFGAAVNSAVFAATPKNWVNTYDDAHYAATGTITFNDWGYTGPNGVGANDFTVTSPVTGVIGFDPTRIGQQQNVITLDPDWKTRDPAITSNMPEMFGTTAYPNTSQDALVNFYAWTYTTVGGSTFNTMQIDKAGNYFVAKNNMNFVFYDTFVYHDITGAPGNATTVDTWINFKPYAASDAKGWCGSVLNPDPNAVAVMAGQVTFDMAMDVYLSDGAQSLSGGATQIIPGFVMRSYGSYTVSVNKGGFVQSFTGSAVMNNNNPEISPLDVNGQVTGAALDPNYHNRVSFLGAGVVPKGAWVTADSYLSPGVKKLNPDGTWNFKVAGSGASQLCDPANPVTPPEAGAVCYGNAFNGYAFLMRADGQRTLTYVNPTGHSDYICPCWSGAEMSRVTGSGGALACGSTATTATIRDSSPLQYALGDTATPSCRFADTSVSPSISRRLIGISSDQAKVCYQQVRQACSSLGL